MKKSLLLLIPVVLFAQVEIDTVIRLPSHLGNGCFIPELNKLYVLGVYQNYVLDCSTYQLKAQIPRPYDMGIGYYSWNWRRQKLYVGVGPSPCSLQVIDAVADTLIRWMPIGFGWPSAYVATTDRLCAADTVVRAIPPPESGYVFSVPSWDSVGNKLYVPLGGWGLPAKVAVYDCATDSLLALIDLNGPAGHPGLMNFDQTYQKAYFASNSAWGSYTGVIDTRSDTLIKLFPIRANSMFNVVAVDTKDHKAYIAGLDTLSGRTVEALCVIDCATDSVVKELTWPRTPWDVGLVRWTPWSNRVYLTRTSGQDSFGIIVVDCNTDSIIVPDLVLGYWSPFDLQIDPIRERVFAIGAESTTVHVLRDVEGGVTEEPASAGPALTYGLDVQMTSGGYELRYSVASPCRVGLSVYDLMGREVRQLVAEEQPAGQHRVVWNRTDRSGATVAPGVYFVRLDASGSTDVKKAVVTR
jgi:hypothetical protein